MNQNPDDYIVEGNAGWELNSYRFQNEDGGELKLPFLANHLMTCFGPTNFDTYIAP